MNMHNPDGYDAFRKPSRDECETRRDEVVRLAQTINEHIRYDKAQPSCDFDHVSDIKGMYNRYRRLRYFYDKHCKSWPPPPGVQLLQDIRDYVAKVKDEWLLRLTPHIRPVGPPGPLFPPVVFPPGWGLALP